MRSYWTERIVAGRFSWSYFCDFSFESKSGFFLCAVFILGQNRDYEHSIQFDHQWNY